MKTQGCRSYIYRLTTFSLCYDDNGDLSTADTCRVQCYEVPDETTEEFLRVVSHSGCKMLKSCMSW
jgi:hypothetical protein